MRKTYFLIPLLAGMLALAGCGGDTPASEKPKEDTANAAMAKVPTKVVTPPADNSLLAPAQDSTGKWGYINNAGEWVIKAQYDEADVFSEDRAVAYLNGANGLRTAHYLDKTGKVLKQFDGVIFASMFKEGHAVIGIGIPDEKRSYFKFINRDFSFTSGLPEFSTNYYWGDKPFPWYDAQAKKIGFIDTTGKMIIKPEYDAVIYPFAGGFCPVQVSTKFGYINLKGEFVMKPNLAEAFPFFNGYAIFRDSANVWGFIDSTLKVTKMTDPSIELYPFFTEGLLGAKKNGKWGMMNDKAEWVVQPTWFKLDTPRDFGRFSEGLRAVAVTNDPKIPMYAYVDHTGKQAFPGHFADAGPFMEGLAYAGVMDGPHVKYGVLDKNGNWAIPPTFRDISRFVRAK